MKDLAEIFATKLGEHQKVWGNPTLGEAAICSVSVWTEQTIGLPHTF